MTETPAADRPSKHDDSALEDRYGKIGLPAVAAAMAYRSESKNPAYAPVVADAERWLAGREAA